MTALDTNVIVRFLVRDDEKQAQLVYARFKQAEASREVLFVPLLVVLEMIWVLESAYGKTPAEVLGALEDLMRLPILAFGGDKTLRRLVAEGRRKGADVSDQLIALAAEDSGCEAGLTFDRRAAKSSFFRLLA